MSYAAAVFRRYRLPNMFADRVSKAAGYAQAAFYREHQKVSFRRRRMPPMLRYCERSYMQADGERMELDSRVGCRYRRRRSPPRTKSWLLTKIQGGWKGRAPA